MNGMQAPLVVGFDGSEEARLALRWAVRTAVTTSGRVRVVVVTPDPDRLPPELVQDHERGAHEVVDAAKELAGLPDVKSETVLRFGWATSVLREEALGASALVVGSQGHGPIERHLLGSVSHYLAGRVRSPLVVVREPRRPGREIVVGVDGSAASLRALAYAASRASLTGEELVAVHAYRYPTYVGLGYPPATYVGGLAVDPVKTQTRVDSDAELLVAESVAGLACEFPDLQVRTVATVGRASRVLARVSERASLVVVGARGHNPVLDLVVGSTCQETLYRAACPVAVVP